MPPCEGLRKLTFFASFASMYGPFLSDRVIRVRTIQDLCALSNLAARNNKNIRVLFWPARFLTFACGFAPLRAGPPVPASLPTFAAAVRVIYRIHRSATHCGPNTHPSGAPRFAQDNEPALLIRDFADRSPCGIKYFAHFGGGQTQMRVGSILRDDLRVIARRARYLASVAGLELDRVDECSHRHLPQGQSVAGFDGCILRNNECVADLECSGHHDVALLTVGVHRKTDEGGAKWVVLDRDHARWDVFLLELEINVARAFFVTATYMTGRDAPARISPA